MYVRELRGCFLSRCQRDPVCSQPCGGLLELWDKEQVSQLSMHPMIDRIIALGKHGWSTLACRAECCMQQALAFLWMPIAPTTTVFKTHCQSNVH